MDARLAKVTAIAGAWPDSECQVSGTHATFRVKGKPFAYFLDDHHGDGIVSVCVRTELGDNEDLARREPQRFYLPAYIGKRGWVALRLDSARVRWSEVAGLIERSYRLANGKAARRSDAIRPANSATARRARQTRA